MTVTLDQLDQLDLHHDATTVAWATDALLTTLHDAVAGCAECEPDLLASYAPAGAALVALARLGRTGAGLLGAAGGRPLSDGPGVVVVRDLVAATRVLARAAAAPGGDAATAARLAALVPAAEGLRAAVRQALIAGA